eukprot:scaffold279502_cov17-Tisochrysis_lutea.AAC.2
MGAVELCWGLVWLLSLGRLGRDVSTRVLVKVCSCQWKAAMLEPSTIGNTLPARRVKLFSPHHLH